MVPHGRRALARLSANFYKRPAERLRVTGVTGTNGKTTTAFIVEAILQAAGRKNALVGTVEYHLPGEILAAPHTTPESLELNQMFARALARGATEAVMEVSSHALQQARIFGIPFDVAIFTNLTQDHLDYHGTMAEYFAAKRILFEGCGTEPPRCAIVNLDDEYGRKLAEFSRRRSQVFTYGIEQGDFHAEHLEMTPQGNNFALTTPDGPIELRSPLIGRVNVYNVLAACAAAYARGCTAEQIARGIAGMSRVPGRFERVDEGAALRRGGGLRAHRRCAEEPDAPGPRLRPARQWPGDYRLRMRRGSRPQQAAKDGTRRRRGKRLRGRHLGQSAQRRPIGDHRGIAGGTARNTRHALPPSPTAAKPLRSPSPKRSRETLF